MKKSTIAFMVGAFMMGAATSIFTMTTARAADFSLSNSGHNTQHIDLDFRAVRLSQLLADVFEGVPAQYVYVMKPDGHDPVLSIRYVGTLGGLVQSLRDILAAVGYDVSVDLRGRLFVFPDRSQIPQYPPTLPHLPQGSVSPSPAPAPLPR